MGGTARDVVVRDGKGSRVDVGNGLLGNNNNNLLLIIIAIVVICCLCGGNNDFSGCGGGGRHRRRRGGAASLFLLLIPLLFLRGSNSGPNTNTNIINVDGLGFDEGDGGFLDL